MSVAGFQEQGFKSYFVEQSSLHVAIIMDGNGRWAVKRGMPRTFGHRAGVEAVRRTVEASPGLGIDTLTLYAFSSDNWTRPATEVEILMRLFKTFLASETEELRRNGVRLSVIGRRDRLHTVVTDAIEAAERATEDGTRLHLRVAVDYSGRDAILGAAQRGARSREDFTRDLGPDVDLLIRTGGEQRLSDFLLWECAYAELVFTAAQWPDFSVEDLEGALQAFHSRERRFGGTPYIGQYSTCEAGLVHHVRRDRWLR